MPQRRRFVDSLTHYHKALSLNRSHKAALEGLEIGGRPARCKVDERPDDDAARAAAAAAAAKARLDGSPS